MQKRSLLVLVSAAALVILVSRFCWAEDKIKFGSAVDLYPPYYLATLAADEKGFWKKNGIAGEWVAFKGGGPLTQAIAAKAIKAGYTSAINIIRGVPRGLPAIMVADHHRGDFSIWVKADSPLKKPADLEGKRVGISSLGSSPHALGRAMASALNLEGKVRFIAVGGLTGRLAALKSGSIEGFITNFISVAELNIKGELRELVKIDDYLPKEWVDNTVVAHVDSVKNEADLISRVVKSSLQAVGYVVADSDWAVAKMKTVSNYSTPTAQLVYKNLVPNFTKDGKVDVKGLKNVSDFLVKYALLKKEEAPSPDKIYTDRFVK